MNYWLWDACAKTQHYVEIEEHICRTRIHVCRIGKIVDQRPYTISSSPFCFRQERETGNSSNIIQSSKARRLVSDGLIFTNCSQTHFEPHWTWHFICVWKNKLIRFYLHPYFKTVKAEYSNKQGPYDLHTTMAFQL